MYHFLVKTRDKNIRKFHNWNVKLASYFKNEMHKPHNVTHEFEVINADYQSTNTKDAIYVKKYSRQSIEESKLLGIVSTLNPSQPCHIPGNTR